MRPDLDRRSVHFLLGDVAHTRSVSGTVLSTRLAIAAVPTRLLADWERETTANMGLEAGDVEALPLARARTRWPDYRLCVQAVTDWTRSLGLPDVLAASEVALMACRGARDHHDAAQYGGAAFCNLFVSEDKDLEVHFAGTGQRIPLVRGTAFIFDTAQVHAVMRRGSSGFDPADFAPDQDCLQVFLTWELPIDHVDVARALGIRFDADALS